MTSEPSKANTKNGHVATDSHIRELNPSQARLTTDCKLQCKYNRLTLSGVSVTK